jgi:hypothetical protein
MSQGPKSGTKYFIRKQFHHKLKDGTIVYYDVKVRYELPKVKKEDMNVKKSLGNNLR